MEFEVIRPSVDRPTKYTIELDENFLLWIMSGIDREYQHVDNKVAAHVECDRRSPTGCTAKVREIAAEYGSIKAAMEAGVRIPPTGACMDELFELHGIQLELARFLMEARFVRENREVRSEPSFRRLQAEAREVTAKALRTMEPTGYYAIVRGQEDELPELPVRTSYATTEVGTGGNPSTGGTTVVSDVLTARYELDPELLETAERVRDGLKRNGVINADQEGDKAA